jgi:geranyl-CoA carboxylase alpha subunit
MLTRTRDGLTVLIGERSWTVTGTPDALIIDGQRVDLDAHGLGPDRVLLRRAHRDLDVTDVRLALADTDDAAGAGVLTAPMHGAVTAVEVVVGDRVARGASIIAIEAMKMEHVLVADVDGVVAELAALGAQVATGAVLARIEPDGDGYADGDGDTEGE